MVFFGIVCAISTMNFALYFPTVSKGFQPLSCGKLCGNCAKLRISRQKSTGFSKEPVENPVKRFLKSFYF